MMKLAEMLILLVSSVASFLAVFLALLTLLRRASVQKAASLPVASSTFSPTLTDSGKRRSDWACINDYRGDLKDPYSESLPLARRA